MKTIHCLIPLVALVLSACGNIKTSIITDDPHPTNNMVIHAQGEKNQAVASEWTANESQNNNHHTTNDSESLTVPFEWEDGAIAATAFFDYLDSKVLAGDFQNWPYIYDAYAEAYPIFADIPLSRVDTLALAGDEVFCVIPRFEGTRIIVEPLDWPLDDDPEFKPVVGDIVFDDITVALVIMCNVSDIFTNTRLTITVDDIESVFSPSISLRDGAIRSGDNVQALYLEGVYAPVLEID